MLDGDPQGGGVIAVVSGAPLDGETDDPSNATLPSGDGTAGGDFNFRLNVLSGDADRDETTKVVGIMEVRNLAFMAVGDNNHSPFHVLDGSGDVNIFDTVNVRNRGHTMLPGDEPGMMPPPQPAPLPANDPTDQDTIDLLALVSRGQGSASTATVTAARRPMGWSSIITAREAGEFTRIWNQKRRPQLGLRHVFPHPRGSLPVRRRACMVREARVLPRHALSGLKPSVTVASRGIVGSNMRWTISR